MPVYRERKAITNNTSKNPLKVYTFSLTIIQSICSIKGLSLGSKDYTKELKTVECTSLLGQTS